MHRFYLRLCFFGSDLRVSKDLGATCFDLTKLRVQILNLLQHLEHIIVLVALRCWSLWRLRTHIILLKQFIWKVWFWIHQAWCTLWLFREVQKFFLRVDICLVWIILQRHIQNLFLWFNFLFHQSSLLFHHLAHLIFTLVRVAQNIVVGIDIMSVRYVWGLVITNRKS